MVCVCGGGQELVGPVQVLTEPRVAELSPGSPQCLGGRCPRDDKWHLGAVPIAVTHSLQVEPVPAALPEEGLSSEVLRQLRCRHAGTPLIPQLSGSRAAGAVNKVGEGFQESLPSRCHRLVTWPGAAPRLCRPPWGQRGPTLRPALHLCTRTS